MNEFRKGDRVTINAIGRKTWEHNDFGTGVGFITEAKGGVNPYRVKWDEGSSNTYRVCDLTILIENE